MGGCATIPAAKERYGKKHGLPFYLLNDYNILSVGYGTRIKVRKTAIKTKITYSFKKLALTLSHRQVYFSKCSWMVGIALFSFRLFPVLIQKVVNQ